MSKQHNPADSSKSTAPTRNRSLLINGGSLLAVFAFVALLIASPITMPKVQSLDDTFRAWIGAAPGDANYQWFLPVALQYGGDTLGAAIICAVLVVVCLIFKRWWHALYAALSLFLVAGVLAQIFKALFDRERPAADEVAGLYSSIYPTDTGSFPSGHSAAAGVFAVTFVVLAPWAWTRIRRVLPWVGALLVIAMMLQRTLTNAHWLSDTIAGAALGVGGSLLLWYVMQPKLDAEQARHQR